MDGYWGNEDATREVLLDGGWLVTGDVGRMDEDGYLYIVDRRKDMIISGGENIYARDVEDTLLAHPEIREVAVVGGPHPRLGEQVVAYVVRRDGSELSEASLTSWVATRLASYKKPGLVLFEESLPRVPRSGRSTSRPCVSGCPSRGAPAGEAGAGRAGGFAGVADPRARWGAHSSGAGHGGRRYGVGWVQPDRSDAVRGAGPASRGHHVLGGQGSGRIVAAGPGVEGLEPGRLVALYPYGGCGSCARCAAGNETLCRAARLDGVNAPGMFTSQYTALARDAVAVPDGIGSQMAALASVVAVAWHVLVCRGGLQRGRRWRSPRSRRAWALAAARWPTCWVPKPSASRAATRSND